MDCQDWQQTGTFEFTKRKNAVKELLLDNYLEHFAQENLNLDLLLKPRKKKHIETERSVPVQFLLVSLQKRYYIRNSPLALRQVSLVQLNSN